MKKIFFFLWLILTGSIIARAQTKMYDIFSYTSPAGFVLKEKKARLLLEKKEGNSFCQLHVWPAQQGSADAELNFSTDWDYFAAKPYKLTTPPEKQTEKQNGWDVVTAVSPVTLEGMSFVITVSTFTQNSISWCAITLFNDKKYLPAIDKFLMNIKADSRKFVKTNLHQQPANNSLPASNNTNSSGLSKPTTNFDDGWVSVVKEDWVETVKGNIKAYIHYPHKKLEAYNSDAMEELKTAWNVLVSPRYSNAVNMFFKPGDLYFEPKPDYAGAEMTENATGKRVYVIFYRTVYSDGSGKYVEIIAPNQTTFEKEFGNYETNKASRVWTELDKMQRRNKFAVTAKDLTGTWTTDFGAAVSYVYVSTGLYAGTDTHTSAENFQFSAGNKYEWNLSMASGQVGNMKFQGGKSNGGYSTPDDWHVQFSDISGKPKTYEAFFSCIKGLRILWLDGKPYAKQN